MNKIFEDLFVLELANNHNGSIEKGKKIIDDFSLITKNYSNEIKIAIKLQFRDSNTFVHKDYINSDDKYVKKVLSSKLDYFSYKELVDYIKEKGFIAVSTPFDEISVDYCKKLNIDIIKIASSDITNLPLIEKIIQTKKPVIVSTGGAETTEIDNIVSRFEKEKIPIAINHCVSIYPSEKEELFLDKIDFLKKRLKNHTIGFSTHEYNDNLEIAMYIAYAKGARTFERHIDIKTDSSTPYSYCSNPTDIKDWFEAFLKAKKMCNNTEALTQTKQKEKEYVLSRQRGYFAKEDLKENTILTKDNIYLAIPITQNQCSHSFDIIGKTLKKSVKKDERIYLDNIN